jgi:hypothetical protein
MTSLLMTSDMTRFHETFITIGKIALKVFLSGVGLKEKNINKNTEQKY